MINLNETIKIADIHANKIIKSLEKIKDIFPVSVTDIEKITEYNSLYIELLIERFTKLQDLMGAKLISNFLEVQGEVINNLSMLDKINKLNSLGISFDTELWLEMRETRNHIAHEYPENPEINIKYLNKIFLFAPMLLKLLEEIREKSSK